MKNATELKLVESISSNYLFTSDFYVIKNWAFDLMGQKQLNTGFNDCFCIVFVKTGHLKVDFANKALSMHTGHVIVEKADYEYKLRPAAGECTIINFTDKFYKQLVNDNHLERSFFFSNPNLLSILLKTSPEIDYLHHQVLRNVSIIGKLEMDTIVFDLVQQIVRCFIDRKLEEDLPLSLMRNHMRTIEKAKEYMNENFADDISLQELSDHCAITPFHFSRTFRKFTTYTPHQYLLNIRLKHAEMLLRNSNQQIADISFASGFNSIEHFATIFRQKFKASPSQYRKK
jgi:AraC family transcriptional regulator